jgi:hypothetical protein
MACTITFVSAGDHPLTVHVEQGADEVEVRIREGEPFSLNETGTGAVVHVNPAAVAFWKEPGQPTAP